VKFIFILFFYIAGCHKVVVGKGFKPTASPCIDAIVVNIAKRCKKINFEKKEDLGYFIFSCYDQKNAHDDSVYVNSRFFVHESGKEIEFNNAIPFCADHKMYASIEIKNEL
tara:strand:+ start:648 stop:980 length:333 start_codon:yes stop_codon:yes gene_type:complete